VDFGLAWLRRQQRSLSRAVLALFCAAWLQAAIVPCVMAHGETAPPPDEALVHAGHSAHGGHDHAALSDGPDDDASHPCLYCPPGESGGESGSDSCDGHGGCAYPHDPTVDARGAGAIFAAVPVSFFAPVYDVAQVVYVAEPSVAAVVPRVPLSVSYCRFIE
jgi:hypothetical protein